MSLSSCRQAGSPYSPKEALKTFRLEPGFRIEAYASEPDIVSPAAMDFDEYGGVYVVEDSGYPLTTERAISKVKLLQDTNGDGLPDRSTVFADQLVMPTGVMRWKKGILVTDAPNIWYFEDTDGDGRADIRRVVLTGFALTNPQHTVNGLIDGLDDWIYVAHEGEGASVTYKDKFGQIEKGIRFPDREDIPPLSSQGRNLRFKPDTYQMEVLSSSSQFGHGFDAWGNHFQVRNSNHGRHEVIAARYLQRNANLTVADAMQDISDHGDAAQIFPITLRHRYEMTDMLWGGLSEFTSACSFTVYLGGAFPPGYEGSAFVAEPANNLVHRDLLIPSGATFVAKRATEGVEFLASTDGWFRPANFSIGPDGALYVVDFYRPVVEHPEYMTGQHRHNHQALYEGSDRGRIYRIVPESGAPPLPRNIRLGDASNQDLVAQLANPNIWWRRTAQRLLIDRRATQAASALGQLFLQSPSPLARLHALWTLEGLGKLETSMVEKALNDSAPGVRENAMVLAESRLPGATLGSDASSPTKTSPCTPFKGGITSRFPQDVPSVRGITGRFPHDVPLIGSTHPCSLVQKLLTMTYDSDPKVRFQLLCTLGYVNSPAARAARDQLLFQDIEDKWMQVAALSAAPEEASRLFEVVRSRKGFLGEETKGRVVFLQQLCAAIASQGKPDEIQAVLNVVARTPEGVFNWWRAASMEGLATGLSRKRGASQKVNTSQAEVLMKLFESSSPAIRRAALRLLQVVGLPNGSALKASVTRAALTAESTEAVPDLRVDAIGLLTLSDPAPWEPMLKKLVDPQEPEPVGAAAVKALGRIKGEQIGSFLLGKWKTMTPSARTEAADALLAGPDRARLLIGALKSGEVQSWTLAYRHKGALLYQSSEARSIFEKEIAEQEAVIKRYQAATEKTGDMARGQAIFKKICSKCHKLGNVKGGEGKNVGPDLATIRNHPKTELVMHILMPNKSIAQNYETYSIRLLTGQILEGVLGPQSPTTITLRHEDGTEELIQRKDIAQMHISDFSIMPGDLDKQIDIQQMTDLLEFLTKGK